jgi:hypothetical protein
MASSILLTASERHASPVVQPSHHETLSQITDATIAIVRAPDGAVQTITIHATGEAAARIASDMEDAHLLREVVARVYP